jgi:hypothetical protein
MNMSDIFSYKMFNIVIIKYKYNNQRRVSANYVAIFMVASGCILFIAPMKKATCVIDTHRWLLQGAAERSPLFGKLIN